MFELMNAKEAREIADKVNNVDTHKIFIENSIRNAASRGRYFIVYSHEKKLPVLQLQNWLTNLGYDVWSSNDGYELHIDWMEKKEIK
jgi:hypothetical protein